jgi:hypothetical protein
MGATLSQQGSLKLNKEQGLVEATELKEGAEFAFEKQKHRLYILDTPMQLLTSDWQAIATIIVTEITIGHGKTKGVYKILKIYSEEERKVVSGTLIPYQETQRK